MVSRQQIGSFIIKKRSIVPNIITMSNMTMGFFAIIYASRGDAASIAIAGILVFIGSLCDASDGAVARALHVESPVGVQLDSLADGIAYGIAPAVIMYQAVLKTLPEIAPGIGLGMIIAPLYPICAIYRLARFNISDDEKNGFNGLPSPAAGIIVSSIPALFPELPFFGKVEMLVPVIAFVKSYIFYIPLYVISGLLMVSRIDYNKLFSDLYKKGKVVAIISIIVIILLLTFFRMWAVFGVAAVYIVAGLIACLFKVVTNKK